MIAGSLEIQLLTGMAQLRSDMAEAKSVVTSTMADITRAVKGAQAVLGSLGLVATVGGLYELAKGAIEGAAQMYRLSQMTGVSVESLSGLRAAAKLSSTDLDLVAKGIQKLSINMVDAQSKNSKAAQTFRALGVEVTDGSGKLKSADQVMLEIAKSQKAFSAGAELNAAMATLFGQRIGSQLLPLLKELADKGTLAGKVTAEQAQQAHEFERQLAQLKAATDGVVRSLALDLLPILTKLPGLFKIALEAAALYFAIFVGVPTMMALATAAFDAYALRVFAGQSMIAALVPATNATLLTLGPTWAQLAAKVGVFGTAVMTVLGVVAAAVVGWKVGTWLRENFVEAQLAGIAFVEGTMVAWERLKYAGAMLWAAFKDLALKAFEGIGGLIADMAAGWGKLAQAAGLNQLGLAITRVSDSIRTATKSSFDFNAEQKRLEAQMTTGIAGVRAITGDMADEAIAHFKAAKAAEEHGTQVLKVGTEATKAFQSLSRELEKYIALQDAWLVHGRDLTEGEKKQAEVTAQIDELLKQHNITVAEAVALRVKLTEAIAKQKEVESAKRDQQNAIFYHNQDQETKKENIALEKAMTDEGLRVNKQLDDQHIALQNVAEDMKAQLALLGATDHERNVALEQLRIEQQRRAEIKKITEDSLLKDKAAAIARVNADADIAKGQAETKAALQDQIDLTRQLQDEGKTLWDDLWSDGHNVLQKLGQDIKKFLIDELYQLVVKKWVFNVSAQITGASGVGSTASAAAGGANMLGIGAGGAYSGSSGIIGAALAGYGGVSSGITGVAAGVGTFGAVDGAAVAGMLGTAAPGGLMAGATAALAAVPVAGWVALGAMALYSMFGGSGHGPKTESGFGAGVPLRGDPSQAQTIVQNVQALYGSVSSAIGLQKTTLDNIGAFVATDPNGTAMTQFELSAGTYKRSSLYGGDMENVGRDTADLTNAVSLATVQAVMKAVQDQATGSIGDYLRSFDIAGSSLETLQNALQVAQDVGSFTKVIDSFGGAFDSLKNLSVQDTAAMIKGLGGVQAAGTELQSFYDDFTPEADKQAAVWRSLTKTFADAGVELPSMSAAFRDQVSAAKEAGDNDALSNLMGMARDEFRKAVDVAMAAGDPKALNALLGAEAAFNQLYPSIEKTSSAAKSATTNIDEWQKAYFASWVAVNNAAQTSASYVGSVLGSIADGFKTLMSGIKAEIDKINGDFSANTTTNTLSGSQAYFSALVALAKSGGRGSQEAAAMLPAAAEALRAIAKDQATSLVQLQTIDLQTAAALEGAYGSVQAQYRQRMSVVGAALTGATYSPASRDRSGEASDNAARLNERMDSMDKTLQKHATSLARIDDIAAGRVTIKVRQVSS